ncbi:hypothetical protein [Advenella mandrilli]|nr:hypothetical protein [Advenella mandrilli]
MPLSSRSGTIWLGGSIRGSAPYIHRAERQEKSLPTIQLIA